VGPARRGAGAGRHRRCGMAVAAGRPVARRSLSGAAGGSLLGLRNGLGEFTDAACGAGGRPGGRDVRGHRPARRRPTGRRLAGGHRRPGRRRHRCGRRIAAPDARWRAIQLRCREGIDRRPTGFGAATDLARLVPRVGRRWLGRGALRGPARRPALAVHGPAEGPARHAQSAWFRLRTLALRAAYSSQRRRALERARPGATPRRQRRPPDRAPAPTGPRCNPAARGRSARRRRAGRARGRRSGRDRAQRLGPVPRHRHFAPGQHQRPARDDVCLAGGCPDRLAVATQLACDACGAGACRGALGRGRLRDAVCAAGGLGRAGAAHGVDAGDGGAARQPGPALALAAGAAGRRLRRDGDRSVGAAAAGFLALVRGGGPADDLGPIANRRAGPSPGVRAAAAFGSAHAGRRDARAGAAVADLLPAGVGGGLPGQPGGNSAGHAADHAAGPAGGVAAAVVAGRRLAGAGARAGAGLAGGLARGGPDPGGPRPRV
jgi:hypothetical protein